MIKYIKNHPQGSIIFDISTTTNHLSAMGMIKNYCLKYLTSYEGYLKAVRHHFGWKRSIPIVLSKYEVYFSTMTQRHYDCVWINYAAIKKYTFIEAKMHITFYDEKLFIIKMSRHKFESIKDRITKIESYRLYIKSNF